MKKNQVTDADREEFLKVQREIRGEEFEVPDLGTRIAQQPPQSMFAMYREALGAPQEVALSAGDSVLIVQPKVKTVKYLLSKADQFAKIADENPVGVFDELQKVMLQCVEFPEGNAPADVNEWFENLPASDGMAMADAFSQVFDINFLMKRAAQLPGKK